MRVGPLRYQHPHFQRDRQQLIVNVLYRPASIIAASQIEENIVDSVLGRNTVLISYWYFQLNGNTLKKIKTELRPTTPLADRPRSVVAPSGKFGTR